MAGSNDFTGQNIQDTYQRVLQISSSGQVADGTGSLVPLLDVTASFAVSASIEILKEVSSSYAETASMASDNFLVQGHITASGDISSSGILKSSQIWLGGTNRLFYDSTNDWIEFKDTGVSIEGGVLTVSNNGNGHITASGNISSSGFVAASDIRSNGRIYTNYGLSTEHFIRNTSANNPIVSAVGGFHTNGNITASGDISASGNIIGDHFIGLNDVRLIENHTDTVTVGFQNNTPIQLGKSANPTKIIGHLTASGDISASGTLTVDTITNVNTTHVTASGIVSASGLVTTTIEGTGTTTGIETSGYLSSSALFVGDNVNHISASLGTLSGSGNIVGFVTASFSYITASRIDVDGDTIKVGGETFNKTLLQNVKDGFGSDSRNAGKGSAVFKGGINVSHVTASGNISASGIIISDSASFKKIYDGTMPTETDTYIEFGNSANAIDIYSGDRKQISTHFSYIAINDEGNAVDFRVEGDADSYLFFTDGDEDVVNIGYNSFNSGFKSKLNVDGDVYVNSHITASGNISSSGNIIGTNIGDISGEFIPVTPADFTFSDDASRAHSGFTPPMGSTGAGGGALTVPNTANNFAIKIVPTGMTAYAAKMNGSDGTNVISYHQSNINTADTGSLGANTTMNTTFNFATVVPGDGITYVIVKWHGDARTDLIYGGQIFIRPS